MLARRAVIAGVLAAPLASAVAEPAGWQARVIAAARAQIGITRTYDPAYTRIAFPGGDVPREKGVCTDVVIRAYRDAFGIDLQELVHADMSANFERYPRRWGLSKPDPSIDHRRVLNLEIFFERKGWRIGKGVPRPDEVAPGDLATQRLPGNLPHIAIVSDRKGDGDRLLAIHNIGRGAEESDVLAAYPLVGRYRMPPAA